MTVVHDPGLRAINNRPYGMMPFVFISINRYFYRIVNGLNRTHSFDDLCFSVNKKPHVHKRLGPPKNCEHPVS